jgi:hypothetical protein
MKKSCDNCYNYLMRTLDLFPMLHCTDAEFDPKVEECSKHNGENCPNWHEKMKISINGRPYRRY